MKARLKALTAIEILLFGAVVVTIFAATLFPSVQSATESGRRSFARLEESTEGSKLSQREVALHNHHSSLQAPPVPADGAAADVLPLPESMQRKIIYTADIQLIAEALNDVSQAVADLVKKHGGFVADSTVDGTSGESRRASWRIRVPMASFDDFVREAKGLGDLTSAKTNSQDVSEEYYDVDARIRNKTKEEERLLKLLEDRPGKLEDVIAIERELSRVREELERMQGRMRVLADRTTLTTVQLTVAEVHNYQPAESPTFATRIRRALDDSLLTMQSTAEQIVVGLVALVPWLAVLAVVLAAIYRMGRLIVRRTAAAKPTAS